ncbi:MAG: V-type ATPase subunit [Candidatus Micrarchaeota archaeon]|nr:V-type ATPase subunit [Candidatus Micrarchaeota archaeon]
MSDINIRAREFGYANARLRAARTQFVDSTTLNAMCDVATVDAMIELMLNTSYAEHVEALRTKYHGVMLVARALMERFGKKVAQIEEMVHNKEKVPLLYVAIGKIEVYNLKLLFLEAMKGRNFGDDYVPVGAVSGRRLERLRAVKDIELLKRIVTEMGYEISSESQEYAQVIDDIERAYYRRIARLKDVCADEPEVRMYIEKIIDYKNFDLAIRTRKFGWKITYLSGGSVPVDKIKKACAEGDEALVRLFGVADIYEKSKGDLSWMEELYERKLMQWIMKVGSANPFSMAGIIGFINRLDVERRNLRTIAVSKGVLKPEEIKPRLMVI